MQQIDHRVIKLLIGIIAILIAFFVQTVAGEYLNSISASYYYRSRDLFVGLLFAISALFLAFTGENSCERKLTVIASFLAAVVALVPCTCNGPANALAILHFPAAASLFAILGHFCWRFRRTAQSKIAKYPEARNRVLIYSLCLAGMIGCALMAVVYAFTWRKLDIIFPPYAFWMEALGLLSFGFSWLAASRTLPVITNKKERFRIQEGSAPEDAESKPNPRNSKSFCR